MHELKNSTALSSLDLPNDLDVFLARLGELLGFLDVVHRLLYRLRVALTSYGGAARSGRLQGVLLDPRIVDLRGNLVEPAADALGLSSRRFWPPVVDLPFLPGVEVPPLGKELPMEGTVTSGRCCPNRAPSYSHRSSLRPAITPSEKSDPLISNMPMKRLSETGSSIERLPRA